MSLGRAEALRAWAETWAVLSPELRWRYALHALRQLDDWKACMDMEIEEPAR